MVVKVPSNIYLILLIGVKRTTLKILIFGVYDEGQVGGGGFFTYIKEGFLMHTIGTRGGGDFAPVADKIFQPLHTLSLGPMVLNKCPSPINK